MYVCIYICIYRHVEIYISYVVTYIHRYLAREGEREGVVADSSSLTLVFLSLTLPSPQSLFVLPPQDGRLPMHLAIENDTDVGVVHALLKAFVALKDSDNFYIILQEFQQLKQSTLVFLLDDLSNQTVDALHSQIRHTFTAGPCFCQLPKTHAVTL